MKILKREVKPNSEFIPVMEVLLQIPLDVFDNSDDKVYDSAYAQMFRNIANYPVEIEKRLNTGPGQYGILEELEEQLEDFGVTTSFTEWDEMVMRINGIMGDEDIFHKTEEYVSDPGAYFTKFMLQQSVVLNGKVYSSVSKICKSDDLESTLEKFDMVYLISKFGALNMLNEQYEETYRIQGVLND